MFIIMIIYIGYLSMIHYELINVCMVMHECKAKYDLWNFIIQLQVSVRNLWFSNVWRHLKQLWKSKYE